MRIQFLGATQTVTGSRFLVDGRLLVDGGLFQGLKELRLRNWDRFPVDPRAIEAVLLTHAHIDHSGFLPRLVRQGFSGPIYATPATAALLDIMLTDSATLQEEEAAYANKEGFSKHKPAMPLYTIEDAQATLRLVREVDYGRPGPHGARWLPAGHLIGSASIQLDGVLFSGDVGRYDTEVTRPPDPAPEARAVLVESTYGNRTHSFAGVEAELARIVNETYARGGTVLIPSFAVGRAQTLLYYIHKLESRGAIPRRPVFVDSPMAVDATEIHAKFAGDPNLKMKVDDMKCAEVHFLRSRDESKTLNRRDEPCIILSSSGMATAGRVLHHLKRLLPEPKHAVLLVGYQAAGTRGRRLLDGDRDVKIHGRRVPVRARVENIGAFSAHGDVDDLVRWLRTSPRPPETIFLVHGEPDAQAAMAERLRRDTPSKIVIPSYLDTVEV